MLFLGTLVGMILNLGFYAWGYKDGCEQKRN
jgi:hypothetical protein